MFEDKKNDFSQQFLKHYKTSNYTMRANFSSTPLGPVKYINNFITNVL